MLAHERDGDRRRSFLGRWRAAFFRFENFTIGTYTTTGIHLPPFPCRARAQLHSVTRAGSRREAAQRASVASTLQAPSVQRSSSVRTPSAVATDRRCFQNRVIGYTPPPRWIGPSDYYSYYPSILPSCSRFGPSLSGTCGHARSTRTRPQHDRRCDLKNRRDPSIHPSIGGCYGTRTNKFSLSTGRKRAGGDLDPSAPDRCSATGCWQRHCLSMMIHDRRSAPPGRSSKSVR